MLKHIVAVRSAILIIGLVVIAQINIKPHMPFYGFRDVEIDFREPETRTTAEVTVAHNKADRYSIPVMDSRDGKLLETGQYVGVSINPRAAMVREQPGIDQTSKPTLVVIGYTSLFYIGTFPLAWILRFIQRRRTARPA